MPGLESEVETLSDEVPPLTGEAFVEFAPQAVFCAPMMSTAIEVLTGSTACAIGDVAGVTLQPAADGLLEQDAMLGSTTAQPADCGDAAHCASVGSTTLQPPRVGVAEHAASVGSTTLQP
jgi:hypothetical protein